MRPAPPVMPAPLSEELPIRYDQPVSNRLKYGSKSSFLADKIKLSGSSAIRITAPLDSPGCMQWSVVTSG